MGTSWLWLLALAQLPPSTADELKKESKYQIARVYVQKLGDKDVSVADEAQIELVGAGPTILPFLRERMEKETNADALTRTKAIVEKLERRQAFFAAKVFQDGKVDDTAPAWQQFKLQCTDMAFSKKIFAELLYEEYRLLFQISEAVRKKDHKTLMEIQQALFTKLPLHHEVPLPNVRTTAPEYAKLARRLLLLLMVMNIREDTFTQSEWEYLVETAKFWHPIGMRFEGRENFDEGLRFMFLRVIDRQHKLNPDTTQTFKLCEILNLRAYSSHLARLTLKDVPVRSATFLMALKSISMFGTLELDLPILMEYLPQPLTNLSMLGMDARDVARARHVMQYEDALYLTIAKLAKLPLSYLGLHPSAFTLQGGDINEVQIDRFLGFRYEAQREFTHTQVRRWLEENPKLSGLKPTAKGEFRAKMAFNRAKAEMFTETIKTNDWYEAIQNPDVRTVPSQLLYFRNRLEFVNRWNEEQEFNKFYACSLGIIKRLPPEPGEKHHIVRGIMAREQGIFVTTEMKVVGDKVLSALFVMRTLEEHTVVQLWQGDDVTLEVQVTRVQDGEVMLNACGCAADLAELRDLKPDLFTRGADAVFNKLGLKD